MDCEQLVEVDSYSMPNNPIVDSKIRSEFVQDGCLPGRGYHVLHSFLQFPRLPFSLEDSGEAVIEALVPWIK